MTSFRFPGESDEYRAARDELLELEKEHRALGEAVAARRRALPLGGRLKEDYVFERADADGVHEVAFEELFDGKDSLLVYTMMFGPDWDAACPSCTSIVDGLDSNYVPVSHLCGVAVVSAAGPEQMRDWAAFRGWKVPALSAGKTSYLLDYFGIVGATDATVASMMNAFHRTDGGIFHTWGSELVAHPMENGHPRHADSFWPMWNLLDLTREGRGARSTPKQDYEHEYFTENVFREPE